MYMTTRLHTCILTHTHTHFLKLQPTIKWLYNNREEGQMQSCLICLVLYISGYSGIFCKYMWITGQSVI